MELIFCSGPTGTSLTICDVHMCCSGNISALKCQPWTCDLSPASEAKVNSVAGRNVRWVFLRTWRWPPLGTQKKRLLDGIHTGFGRTEETIKLWFFGVPILPKNSEQQPEIKMNSLVSPSTVFPSLNLRYFSIFRCIFGKPPLNLNV